MSAPTPEQRAVLDELTTETHNSVKALEKIHGGALVHLAVHVANIRLMNNYIEARLGPLTAKMFNDQLICVFDDVCKKMGVDERAMYTVAAGLHDQIAGFRVQLHQLGMNAMPFAHATDDDDQSKEQG